MNKKNTHICRIFGIALCSMLTATTSVAFPSLRAACFDCHDTIQSNKMQITPQSLQIDLGTQLDGSVNGFLDAFSVEPGATVALSMDVLSVSGKWAAVLKQFNKGGQELDQSNMLVWSQSGNTGWNSYLSSNPPYMATTVRETSGTTLEFMFTVDASTPPDIYELVFAIAGPSGMFYQEESFYLEVTAPKLTSWAGYDIDANGNIDTGSWLGVLHVGDTAPWAWVYDQSKYIYLPDMDVTTTGGWIYIPR